MISTPIRSLVYVSTSRIAEPGAARIVDDLVADAKARNAAAGVTGALLFTQGQFAQVLEGPRASVDLLMRSISRDPRHRDLTVVSDRSDAVRRFPEWSMAYSGPSHFAARQVGDLLLSDAAGRGRATERLLWMMREFIGHG